MQSTPDAPTGHSTKPQRRETAETPSRFKTREQELLENDRAAWIAEQLDAPILGAVCRAAQAATRQGAANQMFFEHYLPFFRTAELMRLPVEGEFLTEWFALAFESAYELATQRPEQANAWLDENPVNRHLAEVGLRIFTGQSLHADQNAHLFVKRAVQRGHFHGQPAEENRVNPESLIAGVETFFWIGIFAATKARHDFEALDLIEWLDQVCGSTKWDDTRRHIHLIRQAPLQSDRRVAESLPHPLLRIAGDKYKNSPIEGNVIGSLLEQFCMRAGIGSETEIIWRDLHLAQWIRDAAEFGAELLSEQPATVEEIFATTSAFTGDDLGRFYHRVLDGVRNIGDFVELTIAFVSWQARVRGTAATRYHGERLETVVECVDAAVWLPWWLARDKGDVSASSGEGGSS